MNKATMTERKQNRSIEGKQYEKAYILAGLVVDPCRLQEHAAAFAATAAWAAGTTTAWPAAPVMAN